MRVTGAWRIALKRIALSALFSLLVFGITKGALLFEPIVNATTVAFAFLILVILSAVFAGLSVAIVTSLIATLCYNYFFLPPLGTFRIAEFNDWVALFVFLFTSILISRLTASTRQNFRASQNARATIDGLKHLGEWLLQTPRAEVTLSAIARESLRIFDLEYCSIHVYTEGKWHHFTGAAASPFAREIQEQFTLQEDHPTGIMELIDEHGLGVRYAQIQTGSQPLAVLVVKSESLPANAIGSIAYMIGVRLMELLEDQPVVG